MTETNQVLTQVQGQATVDDQQSNPSEQQQTPDQLADLQSNERLKRDREQKLRLTLEERERELAGFKAAKEEIQNNGWDIDELRKFSRNGSKEVDPVIKSLNEKVNALEHKAKKLEQERYDREELREIEKVVASKSNDFEFVKAYGVEGEVQAYIKKHFEENKVLLPIETAARHIEEQIEKFERDRTDKLKSTTKARKIYSNLFDEKSQKKLDEQSEKKPTKKVEDLPKQSTHITTKFKEASDEKAYVEKLNDRDMKAYLLRKYS